MLKPNAPKPEWITGHPKVAGLYWFYLIDSEGGPYVRLVKLTKDYKDLWRYEQCGWSSKFSLFHLSDCYKHIPVIQPKI